MVKLFPGESYFYKNAKKELFSVYYSKDLAIRHPLFTALPEPEPRVLVRPLSPYGVYLGKTTLGRVPFYWDPDLYSNPLIALIGMPGGGKSITVKTLLINMKKKGIKVPIIIVDPEDEYGAIVRQLGEGIVLNIGTDHFVNIFDRPYPEMPYQLWVRKTVIPGIIKAARINPNQAPQMTAVLEEVIFKVYELKGFDPINPETWKRDDPTLLDVVQMLEGEIKEAEENKRKDSRLATKRRLYDRLKRWTKGMGSDFFAHPSTIRLRDLLKQPIVVFNIKKLPKDGKDLFNFFIFNYFYSLMEMTTATARVNVRLKIFLIFDEGWILLKRERGEEAPLAELFRRARKYGFAALIATQQYKDISEDILPLVGTVMIVKIRDYEAIKKLSRTLGIPKRIAEKMITIPVGRVVVAPAWKKEDFQGSSTPFMIDLELAVEPEAVGVFYELEGEEVFRALKAKMVS